MKKLDFVIVGTFKSATSTLAYHFQGHPEVSIPTPKDPYYFLKNYCAKLVSPSDYLKRHHDSCIYDDDEFERLFENKTGTSLKFGEATPLYLYRFNEAIENIKRNNPKMKIVIVLRNPVERAFSNYMHNKKDKYENREFSDVINSYNENEKEGLHPFFHYVKAGFYHAQVQAYKEAFNDVCIISFEELTKEPEVVINKVAKFLGVSKFYHVESQTQLNKTGIVRNQFVYDFLLKESPVKSMLRPIYRFFVGSAKTRRKLAETVKNKNLKSLELNIEDRKRLETIYRKDVKKLSNFLQDDFGRRWF